MSHRKGSLAVNTQMEGSRRPSMPSNSYDAKPFNQHPGVQGQIPTRVMDHSLKPSSRRPTPTQTAGAETRAPRPGTRQRAFGKSNT